MRIIYIPKKVSPITTIKYGLLYNFYATQDSRKITSSDDWSIATYDQVNTFLIYIGGISTGYSVKEVGTTYWNTATGTNTVGFNIRGNGTRNESGTFNSLKTNGLFWFKYTTAAYFLDVRDNNPTMGITGNASFKIGNGIRLIYTGAGTPTSYTGNDGKIYNVVTVGTQTWLSSNLAETKYRTLDAIAEVTDGTAWAALTTGALCAYNNDWSNV